jgi:tetratricopeptide (TPR) repeat protein
MRGSFTGSLRFCVLIAACGLVPVVATAPAAAASYSPYAESAAAALARYVRTLAGHPKDFSALIGAGRAALALGDTHAAAGFFARADEVDPRSPLPQAGMGAVSVANGEPNAALPYFARAQQLGAPIATYGCDRGLAYDLLGQQPQAQADYRAALGSPDGDEARRRLALSLAISGNKTAALQALQPLLNRGDAEARRAQAFVLALTGDSKAAMVAFDAAMPGSWSKISPFLERLPALASAQKAAAVNLGIFPDSAPAYAYAAPTTNYGPAAALSSTTVSSDRLTGIDEILRASKPPAASAAPAPPTQMAYAPAVAKRAAAQPQAAAPKRHRLWLQLASGQNADALSGEFRRMKSKYERLFDGIDGYVARSDDRARLVIGPFRGKSDAEIFADDLHTVGLDAFSWTNSDSDRIVPLGTE